MCICCQCKAKLNKCHEIYLDHQFTQTENKRKIRTSAYKPKHQQNFIKKEHNVLCAHHYLPICTDI